MTEEQKKDQPIRVISIDTPGMRRSGGFSRTALAILASSGAASLALKAAAEQKAPVPAEPSRDKNKPEYRDNLPRKQQRW